jgi:hypothetical protein
MNRKEAITDIIFDITGASTKNSMKCADEIEKLFLDDINLIKKFVNEKHSINCALTYDIIEFIDDQFPAPPENKQED